jgi:protein-disulfide isomerase
MKNLRAMVLLFMLLSGFLLSGCGASPDLTPLATYTPYPTYTLYPTYTPFPATTNVPTPTLNPLAQGMSMGDPNAKVKVVEFADFQCSHCQDYFTQLEPMIIDKYVTKGLVYYTYSPMAFLGPGSTYAAEAAYCANDQGKFWEYRSAVFNYLINASAGSFSQQTLIRFAEDLGLDGSAFSNCLINEEHSADLVAAHEYANENDVTGTPLFLVNGSLVGAGDLVTAIESVIGN